MRVQFDATLDDCVDTWARASKYSRSSRHWLWSEYFFGMILAGVSTAGLLHFLNIAPGRDNTVAALIGGGLAAIAYPWGAWWYTRNRIRESIRESVGTKPFSVEVELLPDGIGAKQNGAQIKYEWGQIESVLVTPESVDILRCRGQLAAVIRDRAFATAEEKAQFVRTVQSYIDEARLLRKP